MREYELSDVLRRRAAGQTWAEIGSAYGKSKASASSWWQKNKPATGAARRARAVPRGTSMPEPTFTPNEPPAPTAPVPADEKTETSDPFEEPVRTAQATNETSSDAPPNSSDSQASTLGTDAAKAYLPLLYGTMDALAGAGAIWLIRRKLGDRATTEILDQARMLASLHDAEKLALEKALVDRLATIELTPGEALTFTVLAIYASKALAISALDVEPPQPVLTLQAS